MENIIDRLLRNGAKEIDIDTIKSVGDPKLIKESYESKGWTVQIESDCLVFDKKDNRQILLG